MLTVVGWHWHDEFNRYSVENVNIWARMIDRNLKMPHRFVVMTDTPAADYNDLIEPVKLWDDWRELKNPSWHPTKQNCYVRLKAFSREAEAIFGSRFVSIDLDCVVLAALDPLFSTAADFKIILRNKRNPYNGSMWLMTTGARAKVWEQFHGLDSIAEAQEYMGTDQAWLCYKLGPNQPGWNAANGVWGWTPLRNRGCYVEKPPEGIKIVFFWGVQKPWNFIQLERERLQALGYTRRRLEFLDTGYAYLREAYC